MKKKILVILDAVLLISGFSACSDKTKNTDDNHSLVNYTDTGDVCSSMNSRTADIEHSTVSSDFDSSSAENSESTLENEKSIVSESSKTSGSSSDKDTQSTVSSTVNTITYYFEHEIDSEIDTSLTSGEEQDSDVNSDTDTSSEISADTDTDTVSSQTVSEEPAIVGSYSLEDIAFYYNGEKIYLGDSIESVIEIVGEPTETEDGVYYYDGFTFMAEESEDGLETYVDSVQFFSKDLSTEKGISVGMTYDDIVKAYGDNITVKDGQQRYYIENKYMYFDIPNEVIANIGYGIDHDVEIDSETE